MMMILSCCPAVPCEAAVRPKGDDIVGAQVKPVLTPDFLGESSPDIRYMNLVDVSEPRLVIMTSVLPARQKGVVMGS